MNEHELDRQQNQELFLRHYLGDDYAALVTARDQNNRDEVIRLIGLATANHRHAQALAEGATEAELELRTLRGHRRRRWLATLAALLVLAGGTWVGTSAYNRGQEKAAAEQAAAVAAEQQRIEKEQKDAEAVRAEEQKYYDRFTKDVLAPRHIRPVDGRAESLLPGQAGWAKLDTLELAGANPQLAQSELAKGNVVDGAFIEDASLVQGGPNYERPLLVTRTPEGHLLVYIINADCNVPTLNGDRKGHAILLKVQVLHVNFCPYPQ